MSDCCDCGSQCSNTDNCPWYNEYLQNIVKVFGNKAWSMCSICLNKYSVCIECCLPFSDKPIYLKFNSISKNDSMCLGRFGSVCSKCKLLDKYQLNLDFLIDDILTDPTKYFQKIINVNGIERVITPSRNECEKFFTC